MPFLVDSVTMELARQQRDVHMVMHPQFDVGRDITGALQSVRHPSRTGPHRDAAATSSASRGCTSRSTGVRERRRAPRRSRRRCSKVLRDVREAVEDWPKMHAQALEIVEDLASDPPPLPAEEVRAGAGAAAAGSPTTTSPSSATGSTASRRRRATTSCSARGARHRLRDPARRPGHVRHVRQAAAAGPRQGPREDPAGAGQGELASRPCTGRRTSTTSG